MQNTSAMNRIEALSYNKRQKDTGKVNETKEYVLSDEKVSTELKDFITARKNKDYKQTQTEA